MNIWLQSFAVAATSALIVIAPASASAANLGGAPSAAEVLQLPKFCWARYKVPGADGPDYRIHGCEGANHYCGGLVRINRAKNPAYTTRQKVDLLKLASGSVSYTERNIGNDPRCSIREHVIATRGELDALLKLYGVGSKPQVESK